MRAASEPTGSYRPVQELRRDTPVVLMLVLMAVAGGLALGRLPARVPVHFGLGGQANGWSGPVEAAFLPVALGAGVWLLLLLLPLADPRRRSYGEFAGVYRLLRTVVVGIVFATDLLTLGRALGLGFDPRTASALLVAALLLVIGNLLPRVRPTWFVGIRTPWTLSSDEVWRRTHRLGGRLFMVAALLPLLAVLTGPAAVPAAVLVAALAPSAVSAGYSWWLYARIGGGSGA